MFIYNQGFNIFFVKFVAFAECGLHNLTNSSQSNCNEYLKNAPTNLTIIDKLDQLPVLTCTSGNNLFLNQSYQVKKGYIPMIKSYANDNYQISSSIDSLPDFSCLQLTNSTEIGSVLFNIAKINFVVSSKKYNSLAINFVYDNSNQTFLKNQSVNYVYKMFGSFSINSYTIFGGNILTKPNPLFINVQTIDSYPFKNIQLNLFDINCTLNEFSLECYLIVNISNYANSFQLVTLDYGDESYDTFKINPYCKYFIDISLIFYMINV